MSQSDISLLAIAGVLFGVMAAHRLSLWRNKRDILSAAITNYKSAFAPEIAAIDNDSFSLDTFAKAFERHKNAVDNIRPVLSKRHQRNLQKAWDEYRGKNNGLGFEEEEFVQAWSATLFTGNREYFREFMKRFGALHSCLDNLLK